MPELWLENKPKKRKRNPNLLLLNPKKRKKRKTNAKTKKRAATKKRKSNATKKRSGLSVFDKHQIVIAKKTLRMSDVGARIMGGMTKAEARTILKKFGKKSNPKRRIKRDSKGRFKKK